MVICDIDTSNMASPFVIYNNTKLKYAKNKQNTLACKFQNRHNLSNGCTVHMEFHNNHWFDGDITIE